MKTLIELAEQYKSDVTGRIETLQDEVEDILLSSTLMTDEMRQDYDAQIAHWQATLAQINETLTIQQSLGQRFNRVKEYVRDKQILFSGDETVRGKAIKEVLMNVRGLIDGL